MKELDTHTIPLEATLRGAMESLSRSGAEVALVVGVKNRLLGILTDGDIRRALLSEAGINSKIGPYINRSFTYVEPNVGRSDVLDIMRARSIQHVPIVNAQGRLIGLHLLREIIGSIERPNWVVVMAGGRGERLRPLTDSIPKPMIKVAGRPILERIVLHLVGYGIRKIFISVNYMSETIENYFKEGSAFGCQIEYLRETNPLGTGGALSLLPDKPEHPILILNGDLMTQVDVASMIEFHASGGYKATLGVHEHVYTVPYGVVDVQGDLISSIKEKPSQLWLANAGIYVLSPDLLARIPKDTQYFMPSLVEECLDKGEKVGAYRIDDDWLDVGRHTELKKARGEHDQ